MSGRIIDNPVNINVAIAKAGSGWNVTSSLTAFPKPQKPSAKDIIFVLDRSPSMSTNARLEKVKDNVIYFLSKLAPTDRFAVVVFSNTAESLVQQQFATEQAVKEANKQVGDIEIDDGTNFINAFKAINTSALTKDTKVIFLTDGEDECSAESLLNLLHVKPRIIPIGVCLNESSKELLNDLFTETGGNGSAVFINQSDDSAAAYKRVFDTVFSMVAENSNAPAQLEMTIEAEVAESKSKMITAKSQDKRELSNVCYDGQSALATTQYFPYDIVPSKVAIRFDCDKTSLIAEYKPTPNEKAALHRGGYVNKRISAFKWQDNSAYSWIIPIAATALGLLMLSGVMISILSSPALMLWTWQSIVESILVSLAGLYLFIKGTVAIARKTFFLPTKLTASEAKDEKLAPEEKKTALQNFIARIPSFGGMVQDVKNFAHRIPLPSSSSVKKGLAGSTLVAGGATIGYFASTTAAASAFIPAGVSASVFVAGCTIASAALLPLLAYGCWQLYSFANAHPRFSAKKAAAGCTLFAAGGTAGYLASTTAAATAFIPASVSASVFVASCTVAGAAMLPLLAYGCWRLYSYASTHPKCPTKKSIATCSLFAASGAAAGYLSSTTSAATALIPTGISASVFVASCTIVGAVMLPLLAYGCWQLHNQCSNTNRRPAYGR